MAVKIIKRKTGRDAVKSFHPKSLYEDSQKGMPVLTKGGESGWKPVGGGGRVTTTTTTSTTTTTTTT